MTLVNQLFPATAFAQPETSVKEFAETVETNDSKEPIEEKAEIIGEIIEKREKNVKHFAMSDSSIKACIYPEAVHYLEEGQYEEIDNSLVESHSENKTYYKNKKNSFTVSFPENYGEDSIRFEDENGYVSFRLLEASNQKLQKLTSYNEKKDSTDVENVNSKVIFPSVRADMDIEYDILGNVLKETIVLNKKTKKSFIFEVQTSAYSAVKNNNNSISFYDDNGTEIYTMDSPFMTDDAGEYSNKVVTELEKTEQGYLLSYTPDYAWLSEKERIYPVRIDPTLVQSVHTSSVLDTYVGNVQTAANNDIRGGWDIMNIGRRIQTVGSSQILARGLIKFDLPQEIGKNDCIVEAKLDLIHRPQEYTSSGTFQYVSNSGTQIDVHELTSAFTEGGTWWGNQPGYNPVIASYGIVNTDNYIGNSGFSYDSYDVTRLVNKWKNGASNYGIMLKLHNEDEWLNSNRQVFYFSKNSRYYGSISKYVEITYRNTTGIESYWNYTMQDFSPYGTAYINNYNGNLVYIHEDTSFYSLINNFTISHVYNVCESDAGVGRYGCGWKLNMVQQLSPISLSGSSNVKYVYIDGDGTRHYFVQTEDGRIADEDGLGYTYADISEGIFVRKITDKDGNMMKFDSSNYLRAIVDPNGNTINLNYTVIPNGEYALTSVTTSSGGNIIFSYDSNGMLTSITDNAGRNTSFTYESGNLRYIQYPDGRRITYDYYGHWMHGIIAPDNSQLRFGNYIETGKIHSTRYLATDGTDGNSLTFLYDYNQTKVTDTLNNVLTYQFDTLGRVSGTYDNKENIYNYTYNATSYGTDIFKNNKTALSSEGSVYVNNYLTNGAFAYGFSGWTPYNPDAMQLAMVTDHSLLTTNTLKIQNTSAVTTCCYQAPLLPERESYTLSAYIKTEQVSSLGRGAAIKAVTSGGRELYSEYLTGTTDVDINEGFTRVTLTFSLENEEILSNIFVGLFDAEGTLYVDSMQLEEGNTANLINLVDNSGFERSSGDYAVPERFETNYTDSYSGSVSSACHEGTKSYKIRGTADESRYVIQRIPLCGKAGDVYTYGGWTKADSVAKREDTYYDVAAHVVYTDGSDDWFWCNLNTQVTDWQFTSDTVITKKDYTAFEVYFAYYNNCNDAYVDAMFLYRDTAQSYTYDTDGNVISTSDYAKQNSTFEYRNNNLSKLLNPDGTGYDYVYDSNHNLKSAFTSEGLQYNLTYDSQGNILSASAENNANSASIVSGRIYRIRSKNSGKYLTAMGTGNTANVDQEAFSLSPGQKWRVTKNTDGSYTLKSMLDENYVLDVENAGSTDGTNLKMCANYFNMAQKFKFSLNEDYTYRILTGITSYRSCVGTSGGSVDNGANVVQMSYVEEDYQHWYFEDVEVPDVTDIPDGVYQIRSRHSGKYMDVRYGTTSSGAVIQQFQSNFADGQKFYIVKRGNSEYYTIAPFRAPELYVAVSSELDANGNKTVKLSDEGITDNTLFKFVYNAKISAYQIVPKSEQSVCVDVPQSSYLNATALILYHKNDFVNQGFLLETVSDRITVKAVCQDNGNFPYTVTDARGNTTTYEYDFSRGVQTAVTDAEGNRTEYSYNAQNDRLESVTTGRSTAGYQYNTDGSIKKITAPSETEYQFQYDVLGRMQGISVGDQMLSHYTYRDPYTSLVSRMDYGNGTYRSYHYDELDRLTGEGLNGTTYRTYTYDKRNNINQVSDGLSGTSTQFSYDLTGRITGIQASDGQNLSYVYDSLNRVSQSKWTLRDLACNTNYIYGDVSVPGQKNGLIYGIKLNGTSEISYEYDTLTRLRTRTLETAVPFVTEYGYTEGDTEGTTTTLVQSVKNGTEVLSYTYDDVGNIVNISKNGIVLESYTYDERNQLKTVTKGNDVWEYTYDKGGNILSVLKNGEAIKSYTYGDSKWKDLLTNYNGETNGDGSLKTYTYDGVGNPLTYRNNMSLTWTAGRQLESITNGADTFSYRYGMDNLRTQKTVNGAITNYYWLNGMLQAQQTGGETLAFLYDEKGSVYGFQMKNDASEEEYYYVFNVQGDVIGIVNRTGIQVVEYTYGVWGELLAVEGTLAETIGQKNPFRYRGYYYDAETGLYYLGSRYYDPEVGRFLNSDSLIDNRGVITQNLFTYCGNNPVNNTDSTGHLFGWVVGGIVGGILGGLTAAASGKSVIAGIATGAATGAAIGFICDFAIPGVV